jgi:ABC-type branched-subunit amino acid transport system permease subunit
MIIADSGWRFMHFWLILFIAVVVGADLWVIMLCRIVGVGTDVSVIRTLSRKMAVFWFIVPYSRLWNVTRRCQSEHSRRNAMLFIVDVPVQVTFLLWCSKKVKGKVVPLRSIEAHLHDRRCTFRFLYIIGASVFVFWYSRRLERKCYQS